MDSKRRDELRKLTNEVIKVHDDDLYCIGYFYNAGLRHVKPFAKLFSGTIHRIDTDCLRVKKEGLGLTTYGYSVQINESGLWVFSSVHKEEVDYVLKLILVHKVDMIFQ